MIKTDWNKFGTMSCSPGAGGCSPAAESASPIAESASPIAETNGFDAKITDTEAARKNYSV